MMKADKMEKAIQEEKTTYPHERLRMNVGTILLLLLKYGERND